MMEATISPTDLLSTTLDSRLRAVWRREQFLVLACGGLAVVRWGLPLFLAGVLIDWLFSLPAAGRVVILACVVGVTLFKAWTAGWGSLRRFEPVRTALQVERLHGGMESLLVSAVQLRETAPTDAQVRLVCGKAEQAAGAIRPRDAIGFGVLWRPAAMAFGAVLLLTVLALTNGGLLMAGLGRMVTPWAAIDYPTRTGLTLADGDLVVQEGSPVTIVAHVSKVVPREATLAIRTGTGKPLIHALPIAQGQCEYTLETAYRSFEYQMTAGDARTAWHRVRVIHAPKINHADITLEFPAYTQRPQETLDALTLTIPETTRIRWKLSLDRPVSGATMNLDGQESLPMEISEDGLTVSFERVASESRAYSFAWVDREHGFSFTSLNNYLQVAPDRPPRVELTSPTKNIYAMLGRKVELAFRGRDDHGIGEAVVAFRIDKTEESRVAFEPSAPIDGTEQVIDWDYRTALPDLAVGQTVSFAVELADRYPGADGPHRARSESRWVQFMSRENYLAHVEKQMLRQLLELKSLYREERNAHESVLRADPSDPVFVQTCQLEAVRQDLMRERVNELAGRMQELVDDLAANSITDHPISGTLSGLATEVVRIANENLATAGPALRAVAAEAGKDAPAVAASKAQAAAALDDSARELGLLVLQLGYDEAADVMAREFHAAAATQAALRLRTIVQQEDASELASAQKELATWLSRLFAATPRDRESTVEEALTAFTLSRVVKQMSHGGMESRLQQAATLTSEGRGGDASRVQAEIIQALLNAESRLRVGAERDALFTAKAIFESLVEEQAAMRIAMDAVDEPTYRERAAACVAEQNALQRKLQLLLMPQVPAGRVRLFEGRLPLPPPVADLLSTADDAMKRAAAAIGQGDREAARRAQEVVELSFRELARIAKARMAAVTQVVRIGRLGFAADELDARFGRYAEQLVALLEETEDAAAENGQAKSLAERQMSLADTVQQHMDELNGLIEDGVVPSEQPLALPACLGEIVQSLRQAAALLGSEKPGEAIPHQKDALATIAIARALLADHRERLGRYGGVVTSVQGVEAPSPFVAEIIEEQRDMLQQTRTAKEDSLPGFATAQKNLVHAVDATLAALASVSQTVESGTVMLFAKEDMQAAAEAMLVKDRAEAIDAQEYIIETLEELRGKIEAVVMQHRFILEITEAAYEASHEGVRLIEAQRRLRDKALAGSEAGSLAREQAALRSGTQVLGGLIHRITGLRTCEAAVAFMAEAETSLVQGNVVDAAKKMAEVEALLKVDAAALNKCLKQIGLALGASADAEKAPEAALLRQVLAVAAQHKAFFRESFEADEKALKGSESGLRQFELALDPLIAAAQEHNHRVVAKAAAAGEASQPANLHLNLVAAKQSLAEAAAGSGSGDRQRSFSSQEKAAESLRHFIVEYANKFLTEPGSGAPPPPPAESITFQEKQDEFELFMPGSVGGERPPGSKLEWEVLGKRQRAALNENFARELPLEHRDTLKNYFERLTQ